VELVNRHEFWPAQCTMKQTMEFQGGVTIKAGQKVKVDGLTPKEVELSALDDKTQFTATPEETDVLTAANEVYAGLTPKQRELSYASLANRKELWPYRVKITQSFDLGRGQRVQAGDEAVLLNIERGKLFVMAEKFRTTYDVAPQATDLLAQARKFVEDKNGAPSRVAGELAGKLVNSVTGKPDSLDAAAQPRYIVLYRGSSTCPITRKFTPTLIKYYNEMKPKHPEFEIVYIMTESPEDTGKFAKELSFSWRAVEYETTARMPITGKPFGDLLPQLIVMDSTGKVLANGIQNTAPAALERLDALLNQPAAP
jgi:nucleoredoxin